MSLTKNVVVVYISALEMKMKKNYNFNVIFV